MGSLVGNQTYNRAADAKSMRCRAKTELRTHAGHVRRSAVGTIISEIDNLGRHLLEVRWENGVRAYVFPHEVEIVGDDCPVDCAA